MATWRDALRDSVATIPNFADHCRTLAAGATGWEHADLPELVGLERWGTELATRDRDLGIAALVIAARAGFPDALAAGGDALTDLGFSGRDDDPILDGAAVEVQIDRAMRWLDDHAGMTAKVTEAFDRTRQLAVSDDDLRPGDDSAYYWFIDVGQCCLAAILNKSGAGDADSPETYYAWPSETCVGRGLVHVARGLRMDGVAIDDVLAKLRGAFAAV